MDGWTEVVKWISLVVGGGGAVKLAELFFAWVKGKPKEDQDGFDFLEKKYQQLQLNADNRCQKEIDRLESIIEEHDTYSRRIRQRMEKLEEDLEAAKQRDSRHVAEIIKLGGKLEP